jgi:hypothetical protein
VARPSARYPHANTRLVLDKTFPTLGELVELLEQALVLASPVAAQQLDVKLTSAPVHLTQMQLAMLHRGVAHDKSAILEPAHHIGHREAVQGGIPGRDRQSRPGRAGRAP